jgi:hypothetical protein
MIPTKAFRKLAWENPSITKKLVKKVYKNGKLVGFIIES